MLIDRKALQIQIMAAERNLPIPFTGNKKRRYCCHRHVRHHNVYKNLIGSSYIEDDLHIEIKNKFPPNNWDDLTRCDQNTRTWKAYRKHQYKTLQ